MAENITPLADPLSLEAQKANFASFVQHERVAADLAMLAIRSMVLVSGGAIIAILTFVANAGKTASTITSAAHALLPATAMFATALCFSIFTSVMAYVSALAKQHHGRAEHFLNSAVTILLFLSFSVFAIATFLAFYGLQEAFL